MSIYYTNVIVIPSLEKKQTLSVVNAVLNDFLIKYQ